jgi:putative transport protein
MAALADALRANPELAIFLTLAIGFAIGRLRIGSFKLGNVVGTLLAGVVIGQIGITVSPLVKVTFFDLFLFATGYKVGPQFFRGLKRNALSQVTLTVVLCVTSLAVTVMFAKLMKYDVGTAAGLLAGAFTESTVIGTASDTIARLDLPDVEKTRLINNIPVAYSVSYLVGTGFVAWFLSSLAPRLLKVKLAEESRRLEAELQVVPKNESGPRSSAYRAWDIRAFHLPDGWAGRPVAEIEAAFHPWRVFVERVRRGQDFLDGTPGLVLQAGDVVAIAGQRPVFFAGAVRLGPEVNDRELLDFPLAAFDVVLTNRDLDDRTLAEVGGEHGRGVALMSLVREGEDVPFTPSTVLNRGDLLRLAGARADVERAGQALGYIERASSETDVVFVGLGIFLGGLVGLLSVTVANIPLSLTASGGALVMGLVFGWLRSVRPTFGRIPEPALWVFDTIGLAAFIGIVGLNAGPGFVSGLRDTGISLFVIGFIVALTPHLTTVLVGRYLLKMNPVILLGACAGAGTATAALRAVQDEAQSKLPVLGYTVPYAIGNILLTAWGPVIVMLLR